MQWAVISFSETRAPEADFILDGGHRLISGRGDSRHLGVAVLLHCHLADQVSRIHISSDRVIIIDLTAHGVDFRIVSIYAPHCGYGCAAFDHFLST